VGGGAVGFSSDAVVGFFGLSWQDCGAEHTVHRSRNVERIRLAMDKKMHKREWEIMYKPKWYRSFMRLPPGLEGAA
jgi:hypothetical protein